MAFEPLEEDSLAGTVVGFGPTKVMNNFNIRALSSQVLSDLSSHIAMPIKIEEGE